MPFHHYFSLLSLGWLATLDMLKPQIWGFNMSFSLTRNSPYSVSQSLFIHWKIWIWYLQCIIKTPYWLRKSQRKFLASNIQDPCLLDSTFHIHSGSSPSLETPLQITLRCSFINFPGSSQFCQVDDQDSPLHICLLKIIYRFSELQVGISYYLYFLNLSNL
jgi:hypothetical protein